MEKSRDNNLPNGNKKTFEASVLRQPPLPLHGERVPEGRERGRHSYQLAYPDRVAILKKNARKNRLVLTDAEMVLWEYLRRNALEVRFRRQFIIGDYIADFACIEKRLVVEVEGLYHLTDEQMEEDRRRTYHISQLGYRVIRFTNEEIMTDINKVVAKIKESLYEQ